MIILGLNLIHGDSAACLIKDGKLIAAVEEERFDRIKHSSEFPINSINFCLKAGNINIQNVNIITVNSKSTYNLFNKIFFTLRNIIKLWPLFFRRLSITHQKNNIKKKISHFFKVPIKAKFIFVPHHLAHAYSTLFFLEDNNNSIIFSFDGSGDFSTTEVYLVKTNKIKLIKKYLFPNSLGLFYTSLSQLVGFKNYGDEYKFMGLAAYGKPIYYKKLKKLIISFDPFKLDMSFFNLPVINYSNSFPQINKLYNSKLENMFYKKKLVFEQSYNNQVCKDIAASTQKIFEEIVINLLINLKKKYNSEKLYLTGGCAFNSLLVGKIIQHKIFDYVFVEPNPGDAGGAVGGAFYACKKEKIKIKHEKSGAYLGPQFSNKEIEKKIISNILNNNQYKINFYENFNRLSRIAAKLIKRDGVIYWFQDKMEWGPRALGNRSILADPRKKNIKKFINNKVKDRELFRPFAVSILQEYANSNFYMNEHISPNMNIVFKARNEIKKKYSDIVHADGSTRIQTVSEKDNKKFYNLIKDFNNLTGCPMLINTSLNIDEPIILSPEQAWSMYIKTEVKSLIINNWLIQKNN
jgi:carbamoyltransferase